MRNQSKLMYGYSNGVANPTTSDKWVVKVITGVYTSHTWGYKYYGTNSVGRDNERNTALLHGIVIVFCRMLLVDTEYFTKVDFA